MAKRFPLVHISAPAPDATSDGDLLRRYAASRDEVAFEFLVRRHAGMVWQVCRGILRTDHGLAEESFQAAFLALARRAHAVRTPSVAAWLFRASRNAALKARARAVARSAGALPEELPTPALSPDEASAKGEIAAIIAEEVDRLPGPFRTPVVLCYYAGYSHAEAARVLGWAVGTVASRVARARDRLRTRLARRGVDVAAAGVGAGLVADPGLSAPVGIVSASVALATGRKNVPLPVSFLTERVVFAMHHATGTRTLAAVLFGSVLAGVGAAAMHGQQVSAPPSISVDPPEAPKPAGAPADGKARPVADVYRRFLARRSLGKVAAAIEAYTRVNGHPPQDVTDKAGRPLLSWRVELLPFLEHRDVYKLFKLDEPWDSPANRVPAGTIVIAYFDATGARSGLDRNGFGMTRTRRIVGPGTFFAPEKKGALAGAVPDKWKRKILVVEAGESVPWAKPDDIAFDPKSPAGLTGGYANVVLGARLAGRDSGGIDSGVSLRPDLNADEVRKLVQLDVDLTQAEFEALQITTSPTDREYKDVVDDLRGGPELLIRLKQIEIDLADDEARAQGRTRRGDAAAELVHLTNPLLVSLQEATARLEQNPALKKDKKRRAEYLRSLLKGMSHLRGSDPEADKRMREEIKKEIETLEPSK